MSVTKQKALVMALITRAIKGDTRAATVIVNLVKLLEPEAQFDDAMAQPSQADQEIVGAFLARHFKNAKDEGQ